MKQSMLMLFISPFLLRILLFDQVIANAVQKSNIQSLDGLQGVVNVQGEDQKTLDVLANDVMINSLKFSKKVQPLHCCCCRWCRFFFFFNYYSTSLSLLND